MWFIGYVNQTARHWRIRISSYRGGSGSLVDGPPAGLQGAEPPLETGR